jgi:hypothetical protein
MYPLRSLLKPGKRDDILAVFSRFQRRTPGLLHRYILYSGLASNLSTQRKESHPFHQGWLFWGWAGEGWLTSSYMVSLASNITGIAGESCKYLSDTYSSAGQSLKGLMLHGMSISPSN